MTTTKCESFPFHGELATIKLVSIFFWMEKKEEFCRYEHQEKESLVVNQVMEAPVIP
jgi:hypothetical protein